MSEGRAEEGRVEEGVKKEGGTHEVCQQDNTDS